MRRAAEISRLRNRGTGAGVSRSGCRRALLEAAHGPAHRAVVYLKVAGNARLAVAAAEVGAGHGLFAVRRRVHEALQRRRWRLPLGARDFVEAAAPGGGLTGQLAHLRHEVVGAEED